MDFISWFKISLALSYSNETTGIQLQGLQTNLYQSNLVSTGLSVLLWKQFLKLPSPQIHRPHLSVLLKSVLISYSCLGREWPADWKITYFSCLAKPNYNPEKTTRLISRKLNVRGGGGKSFETRRRLALDWSFQVWDPFFLQPCYSIRGSKDELFGHDKAIWHALYKAQEPLLLGW